LKSGFVASTVVSLPRFTSCMKLALIMFHAHLTAYLRLDWQQHKPQLPG
jgi:hypothetical protein